MDTKKRIIELLNQTDSISGQELLQDLKISRQALNKHMKILIEQGLVRKIGVTRGVRYEKGKGKKAPPILTYNRIYPIHGLAEDLVFSECDTILNLQKALSGNVFNLFQYAFTEMLNNAIDHSNSSRCSVSVRYDNYNAEFRVRDWGIGVFTSIESNFGLSNENEAVGELLKGRTTTMAERHSGEGIFFTSKTADYVHYRSHGMVLKYYGGGSDTVLEKNKYIRGTEVFYRVSRQSNFKLDRIFREYAPEEFDYKFEKTRIAVKLFEEEYLSRSSAKRMLYGLEKYRSILLDFKNVKAIGQGFADEVFRVFGNAHPDIEIDITNSTESIDIMVRHVVDNKLTME